MKEIINNKEIGELVGRGRTADVYKYEDCKVIKLYHENIKRSVVEYEYSINLIVNELSINAPKAYEIIGINNRLGIVYDEVKGKTLSSILLSSKDVNFFGEMMAALHLSLHSCEVNTLPNGKNRLIKNITNQKLLSDETRKEILTSINKLPESNRLCHGDFHIDNILKDGEKLTIIDWIDAYSGYPLLDVARSYLIILTPYIATLVDEKLVDSVKEVQTHLAEKYLDCYFENSDYNRDDLSEALKIVAAARLKEQVPLEKEWLLTFIR